MKGIGVIGCDGVLVVEIVGDVSAVVAVGPGYLVVEDGEVSGIDEC